jgi:hypothetical protein
LGKAPAATDGITQVRETVQVRGFTVPPAMRGKTIPPAGGQLLDQLTPEQQAILQQQQQELRRGRH